MSTLATDSTVRKAGASSKKGAITTAVLERFRLASEAKQSWENQAYVDLAFLLGYQWVNWEDGTGFIEVASDPETRYHLVHNLIQPAVRTQVSRIMSHKPWVTALPTTAEERDVEAARLGTKLLEYWRRRLFTSTLEAEFYTWLVTVGTSFWRPGWDAHAGRSILARPLAPYNQTLLSPDRGEAPSARPALPDTRTEFDRYLAEQMGEEQAFGAGGLPQAEEPIDFLAEGDVLLEAVNPFEVYPEPGVGNWDQCSWVIHARCRSRDDVRAAWGDRVAEKAVTVPSGTMPTGVMPSAGEAGAPGFNPDRIPKSGGPYNLNALFPSVFFQNREDEVSVIEYWERPSAGFPSGRHTLVVGAILVHDGHNPFPFNEIPLVHTPYEKIPGSIWGRGMIESLRPAQQEFNMTVSQLAEARDYSSFPKILMPRGSQINQSLGQNIPGEIWEYSGGIPPTVLQAPQMPAYMGTLLQQSYQMIQDLSHQHEVTRGTTPPNVEYGIAIQLLYEADNSPLRSTYDMIDDGLVRASRMLLAIAQKYYTEQRTIRLVGQNKAPQVIAFTGAELKGIVDVYVEARSAQPNTLSAKRKEIMDLYFAGLFGPPGDPIVRQRILAALEMGHLNELFEENQTVEEAVLEWMRGVVQQPNGMQVLMQMLQSLGGVPGGGGQGAMPGMPSGGPPGAAMMPSMMALPQAAG